MNADIKTFCDAYHPCKEGRDWALANCRDMADVWDKAKPEWLIWLATRPGVLDDRTLRLFACWCVRNTPLGDGRVVWDLLDDPRSRNAVEVAERYADGKATEIELQAAAAAAGAAWVAARVAARAAWAAGEAAQANYLRTIPNPWRTP